MRKPNFLQKIVLKLPSFSRNKNKRKKTSIIKRKYSPLLIISMLIIILFGFGSGYLQYSFKAVTCMRMPVSASDFMASYSYDLPGDELYGPNMFNHYYCTEEQAKSAGYHHSLYSDAAQKEDELLRRTQEDQAVFNPDKIDFKVYIPKKELYNTTELEISAMSDDKNHVFFTIKKEGSYYVGVREARIPSDYELCKDETYICSNVGNDANGNAVTKQIVENGSSKFISYGITIEDTFITLENVSSDFTDPGAIQVFSSFVEYKKDA